MLTMTMETDGYSQKLIVPYDEKINVIDPVLTETIGKSGVLTFSMTKEHPAAADVKLLKSYIIVYQDGAERWRGRVLSIDTDLYGTVSVECEGLLSNLNDTICTQDEFTGTVYEYIEMLLNEHNAQTDEYWYPNNIMFEEREIKRTGLKWKKTIELLNELPNLYGGYLRATYEGGDISLDQVKTYGGSNTQELTVTSNILDFEKSYGGDVFTRIYPVGKDNLEYDGGYVQSNSLVEKYGVISVQKTYSDADTAAAMEEAAMRELTEQEKPESITLSAVDLSNFDEAIPEMRIGRLTRLISPIHGINQTYILESKITDFYNPENSQMSFGIRQKRKAFTESVREVVEPEIGDAAYREGEILDKIDDHLDGDKLKDNKGNYWDFATGENTFYRNVPSIEIGTVTEDKMLINPFGIFWQVYSSLSEKMKPSIIWASDRVNGFLAAFKQKALEVLGPILALDVKQIYVRKYHDQDQNKPESWAKAVEYASGKIEANNTETIDGSISTYKYIKYEIVNGIITKWEKSNT